MGRALLLCVRSKRLREQGRHQAPRAGFAARQLLGPTKTAAPGGAGARNVASVQMEMAIATAHEVLREEHRRLSREECKPRSESIRK